jgi:hypothetical protein
MHNLKITFGLSSPVILSRYTTIDSIILARYFNRLRNQGKIGNNFIKTEDYFDEISKFIFIKNNTISGSIWYVPKDASISPYNAMFVKTKDLNHMQKFTGNIQKDDGSGEYKLYRFGIEALDVKEIYFYIHGDKNIIEDLLKGIKAIGKKNSAGFGLVEKITIEEMDVDKSFIINGEASRPLPCEYWNLESDRIMFYRPYPPYYEKTGKVPCYMPPTSLTEYEPIENSRNYISLKDINYIYPTEFAYNSVKEVMPKPDYPAMTENRVCAACGKVHDKGVKLKDAFKHSSNNDYAFLSKGDFVCEYCDWSIKSDTQNYLGYLLITEKYHKHIQGKNMEGENDKEKQKTRAELLSNLDELTPPFYIGIKSSKNQQHVVFKSTVSISNALVPFQYGNDTYIIDVELFNRAIEELKRLINETGISKIFWINREIIDGPVFQLPAKDDTQKNRKLLNDFYLKYDRSIRVFLNRAVITEEEKKKKKSKKVKKA